MDWFLYLNTRIMHGMNANLVFSIFEVFKWIITGVRVLSKMTILAATQSLGRLLIQLYPKTTMAICNIASPLALVTTRYAFGEGTQTNGKKNN